VSYIAFDLDALNVARDVGAAASLPEERITHGLLRMWAWCFREKTDTVTAIQVQGFFAPDTAPALVAFGFLAQTENGFRVRGAERYLRVSTQRAAAGRARSSSAGRSAGKFTSDKPAADQQTTSSHQRTTSEKPALTPSTEHLAPKKETAPTPSTPRESDLLCEDFRQVTGTPYLWQGAKDGTALARLRATASVEEIRSRWKAGLRAPPDEWASCRTVAQLASKWNDLAPLASKPDTSIPKLRQL
jgi:hypothetical protein